VSEEYSVFDNQTETAISGSREVYETVRRGKTKKSSTFGQSDSKTSAITTQVINVKYYARQLDENIVGKWTEIIEKSNPNEFLNEVIRPKANNENEVFLENITKQSEIIAGNLSLPIPQIGRQFDSDTLNLALTKIEVRNYEKKSGSKVSKKTLECLWNERLAAGSVPLSIKQEEQIEVINNDKIFTSKLEFDVFNALLNPDKVKFDEKHIFETQEIIRVEEIAANEITTFIQIAYGGRQNIFTDKFKSNLADKIYYGETSTTDLYHQHNELNWQNTIEKFAPIVDKLAETNGLIIQTPSDENSRNDQLAFYFTNKLISIYEKNNGKVDDLIKQSVFGVALKANNLTVKSNQSEFIAKNTDENLNPPQFKSSLESNIYFFEKISPESQLKQSENIVDYFYKAEQVEIQKQTEAESRRSQSDQLEM
jgi:hypothetical protein